MCNKVKSEQDLSVTSPNAVVVIQASLKLVSEGDTPTSLARIINVHHPKDQNVYMWEDAANKSNVLA